MPVKNTVEMLGSSKGFQLHLAPSKIFCSGLRQTIRTRRLLACRLTTRLSPMAN